MTDQKIDVKGRSDDQDILCLCIELFLKKLVNVIVVSRDFWLLSNEKPISIHVLQLLIFTIFVLFSEFEDKGDPLGNQRCIFYSEMPHLFTHLTLDA